MREGDGFWWGLRIEVWIGFGCLMDEEKVKDWEREVKGGRAFVCFFKCCITFQVLVVVLL